MAQSSTSSTTSLCSQCDCNLFLSYRFFSQLSRALVTFICLVHKSLSFPRNLYWKSGSCDSVITQCDNHSAIKVHKSLLLRVYTLQSQLRVCMWPLQQHCICCVSTTLSKLSKRNSIQPADGDHRVIRFVMVMPCWRVDIQITTVCIQPCAYIQLSTVWCLLAGDYT